MKAITKWYCIRCGELNTFEIESNLPEHFDSSIDKQWIINSHCKCGMVTMLYRNRMEVVQVCQRLTPENKYEEDNHDSIQ